MSKYILSGLSFLLLLVNISCVNTKVIVTRTYLPDAIKDNKLGIEFSKEDISINYEGSVEEEFGKGDQNELIKKYVTTKLPVEIKKQTLFSNSLLISSNKNCSYELREIKLSSTKIKDVKIPQKGCNITVANDTVDFILTLNIESIGSQFEANVSSSPGHFVPGAGGSPGHWMGGGPSFNPKKDLTCTGTFFIWDVAEQDVAAYGYVTGIDENKYAVSMEDWENMINDFVKKILEKTSFFRF